MLPFFSSQYANASAAHTPGARCRAVLETARSQAAAALGCEAEEIIFTSGGTESDNLALCGTMQALRNQGRCRLHLITDCIEHPAILNCAQALQTFGIRVTILSPDCYGRILPQQVEEAFCEDTALVSIMAVNNELGTANDLEGIGKVCHAHGVLFHTDMVQVPGNLPLSLAPVDYASFSSHKFGGPKGVGLLFRRRTAPLAPLLRGGGQESGLRPGTYNLPGIVGSALAIQLAVEGQADNSHRLAQLRSLCQRLLQENSCTFSVNGDTAEHPVLHAPHILSVGFPGADAEALLQSLDLRGFCVSAGSACCAGSSLPSHVLTGIGAPASLLHSTLRISFGIQNTAAEVSALCRALAQATVCAAPHTY